LAIFIGLMLLGLAVFGPIGWLTLRWIGARYERQKLSDQSITLDAIWLVFGIVESIVLFSSLLAFAVYKPISSAGLRLLERDASSTQESA
jgi:NhaP-type Na+/H+ or K+/H+ antiporter